MKHFFLSFIFLFTLGTFAYAEIEYQEPMGVIVQFDENGQIQSIRATAEEALHFGDRQDINRAIRRANLRARSNIAHFLSERIRSIQTINDMTETLIKQHSNRTAEATRSTLERETDEISSQADELLKGVVILLEDINRDEKYVKVEVGLNYQTMQAADQIRRDIRTDLSQPTTEAKPTGEHEDNSREIRRSRMYDDF